MSKPELVEFYHNMITEILQGINKVEDLAYLYALLNEFALELDTAAITA